MRLVLKPKGRGNWAKLTLAIEGAHLPMLMVRVGEVLTLGGVVFRIAEVLP